MVLLLKVSTIRVMARSRNRPLHIVAGCQNAASSRLVGDSLHLCYKKDDCNQLE